MKKRTSSDPAAAVLTIMNGAALTTRGRRNIAAWLTAQARILNDRDTVFASRVRRRYSYAAATSGPWPQGPR